MDLRVKHICGLGFDPGSYVTIKRSGEELQLLGVIQKDPLGGITGTGDAKKEKVDVTKKLHIADIVSVRLSPNVESSSDYGTVVKTFIIINIRDDAGFVYEAVLGGDEIKRITPAYNDLIKILTNQS